MPRMAKTVRSALGTSKSLERERSRSAAWWCSRERSARTAAETWEAMRGEGGSKGVESRGKNPLWEQEIEGPRMAPLPTSLDSGYVKLLFRKRFGYQHLNH